jgi:hypothetical protein
MNPPQQPPQQLQISIQDVVIRLGEKDVEILQLQSQLNAILAIPGVQETIGAYAASQAAAAATPALYVPENNTNGDDQNAEREQVVRDAPQA